MSQQYHRVPETRIIVTLLSHHIPELGVPGEGGDYPGKALDADCVRAWQQLGIVLGTVVIT